ncbi:MAG: alpha/beta hydrolase [Actinomycetales bacterium]|nr:MAG: alpha/beta hydrolase [Actinomycetales bacterium]
MSLFSVPGARISFDVVGDDGPAVVALHGLTSSRRREELMQLDVANHVPGVRLLRYDARGHGRSTGRARPEDYRWPRLAEDLLALVDDVFPGEPVHGVGPSMGTATLLHAALSRPDRFRTLTLMVPPTAWASRRARAAGYEEAASLVETEGVAAFVGADDAPRPPAVAHTPVGVPDVPTGLLPAVMRGAASSDLPRPQVVATIRVPTLVLAWTHDEGHPLSTAETLTSLLPDTTLRIAETPDDLATWPSLVARHVLAQG